MWCLGKGHSVSGSWTWRQNRAWHTLDFDCSWGVSHKLWKDIHIHARNTSILWAGGKDVTKRWARGFSSQLRHNLYSCSLASIFCSSGLKQEVWGKSKHHSTGFTVKRRPCLGRPFPSFLYPGAYHMFSPRDFCLHWSGQGFFFILSWTWKKKNGEV